MKVRRPSLKDEEDYRNRLEQALAQSAALRRRVVEQVIRDTEAKLAALKQADGGDGTY